MSVVRGAGELEVEHKVGQVFLGLLVGHHRVLGVGRGVCRASLRSGGLRRESDGALSRDC